MDFSMIVVEIDKQIATLQQVRELLSEASATERHTQKAVAAVKPTAAKKTAGKRTMSAEGRARIAAAQKKRWALKAATPAKAGAPAKKSASKAA